MQNAALLLAQSDDPTAAIMTVMIFGIGFLIFMVLMIVSGWKVFAKAGKPGWASIIPIYNAVVFLEIIGRPIWWILLLVVPIVGLIIPFVWVFDLAKSFGKDVGFALGLIFLPFIFYPILAFGDATYQGPSAA